MDSSFFTDQINRLIETYGTHHYKNERLKLIWQEVKEFNNLWFREVVDEFIGSSRTAPLLSDIRVEIAKERERLYHIEKNQRKSDQTLTSQYSFEDIQTILRQITQRLKGAMNDQDFECFNKMLILPGMYQCMRCLDTNVYFDDGNRICNHI